MPPKKAAATKAKATAAADRPRRAAAKDAPAPTPAKKAPAKKAAAKTANTAAATPKKRGRPAKTEQPETEAEEDPEPPKKRGRPSKAAVEEQTEPPKKRGRPSKVAVEEETEPPKKRGRPSKAAVEEETDATAEPPKKRGRPAKNAPAVPANGIAAPKKRGRPPKGGETTKIAEDDPAAAEQLEDELVDATEVDQADEVDEVDEAEEAAEPSKRAPPAKKGKGKGRGRPRKQVPEEAVADADVDADAAVDGADGAAVNEDEEVELAAAETTQYWLMKAEQIGHEETLQDGSIFNTKFTIDDLRAKAGPEPWDGVRNPTACKNMREMKAGDLAFFYASGAKGKDLLPGITGIMEVVKEHEPDMSAFDETLPGYVQNPKQRGTKEKPKWSLVHVEYRKKLSKPVTLRELQQFKHDSGVLANMQEFTAARLSVSKVSPAEWNFIVDSLIEGYEDEALAITATAIETPIPDLPTIDGAAAGDGIVPTSETAAPSIEVNDTSRASSKKPSSRPTSRAPSRAASRASSKAPSRPVSQGSLAPPRAQSRGRSRTPASRANSVKPMPGVAEEMSEIAE